MWTESRVMRLIFKVAYRMPNSLNIRNHAHFSVLIKNYVIIRLFLHTHLTVWQRGICSHFYFWWYQGLNSGPPPWATPHVLFYDGLFWDRVLRTICPGWLQTTILLISVSWVTRITDVSYQCPASYYDFLKLVIIRSIHSWKNSSDQKLHVKYGIYLEIICIPDVNIESLLKHIFAKSSHGFHDPSILSGSVDFQCSQKPDKVLGFQIQGKLFCKDDIWR
jgi:hypothetical protein